MASIIKSACLCAAVLCLSAGLFAATYYVDDDGPNDPGPFDPNVSDPLMDGSAGHPFGNIQEGIDASVSGDTVTVMPGTYYERITLFTPGEPNDPNSPDITRNIILTSTDPTDSVIVEATIIDGSQNGSVVTFAGSETAECVLQGFTITNGSAFRGGGIYGNYTHARVTQCTITANMANYYGGGLYNCDGGIANCTITAQAIRLFTAADWFGATGPSPTASYGTTRRKAKVTSYITAQILSIAVFRIGPVAERAILSAIRCLQMHLQPIPMIGIYIYCLHHPVLMPEPIHLRAACPLQISKVPRDPLMETLTEIRLRIWGRMNSMDFRQRPVFM